MYLKIILTVIGAYCLAKTTLIYCDVLNFKTQMANRYLYLLKSEAYSKKYDLAQANIMFSQYFICSILKEVLTIHLLGNEYKSFPNERHYLIILAMLSKEFLFYTTINKYIAFLKMFDEKYENDHDAPYDENGNRPLVPDKKKIMMLKAKEVLIKP